MLPGRVAHLKDKITKVKQQIQALNEIGEQMKSSEDGQISLTDPDARSMATSGRGTGIVGYNVQTVVDAKHHLIVAHDGEGGAGDVAIVPDARSKSVALAPCKEPETGVSSGAPVAGS